MMMEKGMMKIICSAAQMYEHLQKCLLLKLPDLSTETTVYFFGTYMIIDPTAGRFHAEQSRKEEFQFRTYIEHLVRFRDLLKNVPDQPITVNFSEENRWIEVKHVEV